MERNDGGLASAVRRQLDEVFAPGNPRVLDEDVDLATAAIVVFSDHHRGTGDGADDFRRCEPAYCAALGWYLEQGHTLVGLGDVEELWENPHDPVFARYGEVVALEREFLQRGRYRRVWGNHDIDWDDPDRVRERLARPDRLPGLVVHEGLRWRIRDGDEPFGEILLTHGHQGTSSSDTFAFVSKPFVRHGWRTFQRKMGLPSTSPSRNWNLRDDHEDAMIAWVAGRADGSVLVTGHTHRPIFWRGAPPVPPDPAAAERELEELRASGASSAALAEQHAAVEALRAEHRRYDRLARPLEVPSYFNTGCCSFGDGDITGLEIADGAIRLVRWAAADDRGTGTDGDRWIPPHRIVLEEAPLREVFAAVRGRVTVPSR